MAEVRSAKRLPQAVEPTDSSPFCRASGKQGRDRAAHCELPPSRQIRPLESVRRSIALGTGHSLGNLMPLTWT
ncbi:hypothetical protein PSHT_00308 [Puccinia striiformis]|uniref:Uncharacterized protein n=1 Tax=Puccinia striiformis TaxID=27350 RepID=A0A2S4WNN1_9BASI|nr:hypothetical protein PSHT_00308 [Puccinia striiformis]